MYVSYEIEMNEMDLHCYPFM